MPRALHFDRVSKRYGGAYVLDGVSLIVSAGESAALVGPNGAGKSTFLRLAARLEEPTRGRVWLDDAHALADHRACVGYLGHDLGLYDELTGREQLAFAQELRGAVLPEDVANVLGLDAFLDRPLAACSRGQRQRVALAQALVGDAPLLVLDEPTTGLDAPTVSALAALLHRRAQAGACVLLSTHEAAFHAAAGARVIDVEAWRRGATRGASRGPRGAEPPAA